MNLLQLEYFQEVAKQESITKAAKVLNISQSALSIMMGKLEGELGYPLFIRKGRNISITPYGERLSIIAIFCLIRWRISNGSFRNCEAKKQKRKFRWVLPTAIIMATGLLTCWKIFLI